MKRISAVILSFILILTACVSASAASGDLAEIGKTVFTDENWSYEKVYTYGWELDEYVGSAAEIALPYSFAKEYVTTVGDYAVKNNTTVTSVTATEFIVSIGEYAFTGCTALEKVTLFDSLTSLGVGCFYGDSALTDINLQDTSITAVPAYCFAECGLDEVSLPDSCESIGNMAFYRCSSLKKLSIPDSVTEISDSAFTNCDQLVIYAKKDSYAIEYAEANDIDYVITDAEPDPVTVTYIIGDADGDGIITILDATRVQLILADLYNDTDGMSALRGDANQDGLDILDATKIQRYLASFELAEPIGEERTTVIV